MNCFCCSNHEKFERHLHPDRCYKTLRMVSKVERARAKMHHNSSLTTCQRRLCVFWIVHTLCQNIPFILLQILSLPCIDTQHVPKQSLLKGIMFFQIIILGIHVTNSMAGAQCKPAHGLQHIKHDFDIRVVLVRAPVRIRGILHNFALISTGSAAGGSFYLQLQGWKGQRQRCIATGARCNGGGLGHF